MYRKGFIPLAALVGASALAGSLTLIFSAFHTILTTPHIALDTSSQLAQTATGAPNTTDTKRTCDIAKQETQRDAFRTRGTTLMSTLLPRPVSDDGVKKYLGNLVPRVNSFSDASVTLSFDGTVRQSFSECYSATLKMPTGGDTRALSEYLNDLSNYECHGEKIHVVFGLPTMKHLKINNNSRQDAVDANIPAQECRGTYDYCQFNPNDQKCNNKPLRARGENSTGDDTFGGSASQTGGDASNQQTDASSACAISGGTYASNGSSGTCTCSDGSTADSSGKCSTSPITDQSTCTKSGGNWTYGICLPGAGGQGSTQTQTQQADCSFAGMAQGKCTIGKGTWPTTQTGPNTPVPVPQPRQPPCTNGQCGPTGPTSGPGSVQRDGGGGSGGGGGGFGSMGGLSQLLGGLAKGLKQGQGNSNGNGDVTSCNYNDPYGSYNSGSTYYCSGNILYYRSPQNQCRTQQVQYCQNGCDTNAAQCKQTPTGQWGSGTDGQPCNQPPNKPDASTCTGGTYNSVSATNNNCVTGWQCVPNSPTPSSNPSATLSCTPQVVDVGQQVAFNWICANAASSSAAGFDTGGALMGTSTATVAAPPAGAGAVATYLVSCNNNALHGSAQCSVQVNQPTILFVANPASVAKGSATTLGWTTTGMNSCSLSSPDLGDFTSQNSKYSNVNGAIQTPALTTTANFMLTCITFGGQTKTATLQVPAN